MDLCVQMHSLDSDLFLGSSQIQLVFGCFDYFQAALCHIVWSHGKRSTGVKLLRCVWFKGLVQIF